MKTAIAALLFAALGCFAAEPEIAPPDEIRALIRSLPARDRVQAYVQVFKDSAAGSAQQRAVVERLSLAKEGFDRLKTLIRPGMSLTAFPGILALAPRHDADENRYSMILGIPPGWNWRRGQGENENEYDIVYDSHLTIIELRPVIYKH